MTGLLVGQSRRVIVVNRRRLEYGRSHLMHLMQAAPSELGSFSLRRHGLEIGIDHVRA